MTNLDGTTFSYKCCMRLVYVVSVTQTVSSTPNCNKLTLSYKNEKRIKKKAKQELISHANYIVRFQ